MSNKTVQFGQVVLKLIEETYVLSDFISNFNEYKIGENVTINSVTGKVVGYGIRIYRCRVSE